MNVKFKNATKKITAVAASAVMVSSAAFAGSLGDYPNNFVKNGNFDGQVVIGSGVGAGDSAAAASIIEDLRSEFSGSADKVKILYKKSGSGGDERAITRSSVDMNYGETIASVTETLDDSDLQMLADGSFDNGLSDEDFEQTLLFSGGTFNHALRDEVSGVSDISDNVFFPAGATYATYTFELDNAIILNESGYSQSDLEDDFIGETVNVMGNDFTVAEMKKDGADLNEITLIGGANKISLGEGDSSTITVGGISYEVTIQNVDTDSTTNKVLLTINGQSVSIDEFDTEDIAGISVAVTDLVGSSRDSVKGYAEIVLGGQKITLFDGGREVEINDEDVSDIHEEYRVESDFSDGTGFETITITYKVDDDTLLEAGDALMDPLFGGFDLAFDGTNAPNYETIEVRVNDDDISIKGVLEAKTSSFTRDLYHYDGGNNVGGNAYLKGDQDADVLFVGASAGINTTDIAAITGVVWTAADVTFNVTSTGVLGSGILIFDDNENQYLYEIDAIDAVDTETDLSEFLDDQDEDNLKIDAWDTDLEKALAGVTNGAATVTIPFSSLGNVIAFENEGILTIVNAYDDALNASETGVHFSIGIDSSDVDGDDTAEENDLVNITLRFDDNDDEFNVLTLTANNGDFVNIGDADIEDGNSDVREYVTKYGLKVIVDNDEDTYVKVMIPDEQVKADLMVKTGGSSSETGSTIVDSSDVDAKKADLIEDGWSITGTENVNSEAVSFDVSAAVLDLAVSGTSDMIVVGGPAVNSVARQLLGINSYDLSQAGVVNGEAVIRFFDASNSVLVYGYTKADTLAGVYKLNVGGLSGSEERI